ncbi:hypothetical protein HAV22_04145 [Massilia sp. TW-1]|uniref:Uncharacterized protein n=1 Tax=Telluria antibiotica TaxID=2717319 RepID=A0ABX0P8F3_9BURK|nr:hypothetical protein [Telluria antibiotica]NIA52843.1 hypothetical protein [Telluria antibiotica]
MDNTRGNSMPIRRARAEDGVAMWALYGKSECAVAPTTTVGQLADTVAGISDARLAAGTITVPENYAMRTALVPKLLEVDDQMADHHGLNLDPDADSYQLIQSICYRLPYLSKEPGKMRAKGAGLLATHRAAAEDRLALSAIVARVADRLHLTTRQFAKPARANPALAAALDAPMRDVREQAQRTTPSCTWRTPPSRTRPWWNRPQLRRRASMNRRATWRAPRVSSARTTTACGGWPPENSGSEHVLMNIRGQSTF